MAQLRTPIREPTSKKRLRTEEPGSQRGGSQSRDYRTEDIPKVYYK
jgi:hypothetical protein